MVMPGKDFMFGLVAERVDFGLGGELMRPDYVDRMVLRCSDGFDFIL